MLTACIELLGAAAYRYAPFPMTLATLIIDSFALKDEGVADSPVDLLPLVCRELKTSLSDPHERMLALLGELMTAPATDAEKSSFCQELWTRHEEAQQWYAANGEPNLFYAARPEFVLGAAVKRSELPIWVELVRKNFPAAPELVRETRERLLRDGEHWLRGSGHEGR